MKKNIQNSGTANTAGNGVSATAGEPTPPKSRFTQHAAGRVITAHIPSKSSVVTAGGNSLSESADLEELFYSNMVLDFLQKKLDARAPHDKQALFIRMNDAASSAIEGLAKMLSRIPELKFKEQNARVQIRYHSRDEAFAFAGTAINWGHAYPESGTISLLHLLGFAPKEVICSVATHEALHVIYADILDHNCLPQLAIDQDVERYPVEQQQEEQWVRNMAAKLGHVEEYLEYWEVSVEFAGDNWKPLYYASKKKGLQALEMS